MRKFEAFIETVIIIGILTLLLVILTSLAGCGSNIPLDLCEEFPGHPECVEAPVEVEQCADPEAIIRALIDNYERGYADGAADCDVCEEPEECPASWTCDDFEDGRPEGHKPKECRGGGRR